MMKSLHIVVASKNPVKINSTLQAFQAMFPDDTFGVEGVSVPSGVADQPFSDEETYQGAWNRAENAKKECPDADYWVGLEGGIEEKGSEMEAFGWMVVIDRHGRHGKGRTGTFFLPSRMVELIREGKDLGEADDIASGRTNSKQGGGTVGLLTGDIIDRTHFYVHAIIFALIPFRNPDLYS